jgi:hypothetical protein
MMTFIRVVELWAPDRTRTKLEFGGCLCSAEYSEFKAVSENALFACDEGLPGKAWPPAIPSSRPNLPPGRQFVTAWATGMPAINEHLKLDGTIASSLARASGMDQIVVLPVIEDATLKAVLSWYL